jgi:hypothetical protein
VNARAFDLVTRSITTALLALGVLIVAGYEAVSGEGIDGQTGAAFGLIIGVYFGAHVSQNGSSARARRDQIITAEATGADLPLDDMIGIRKRSEG